MGKCHKKKVNFFSEAGISKDKQSAAVNDNGDPFKALIEKIKSVRTQKPDVALKFTSTNLLHLTMVKTMIFTVVVKIMKMTKCKWLSQRKHRYTYDIHYVCGWTWRQDLQNNFKNWCFIWEKMVKSCEITLRGIFFQELNFLFASFFLFIYIKVVFLLLDSVFFFWKELFIFCNACIICFSHYFSFYAPNLLNLKFNLKLFSAVPVAATEQQMFCIANKNWRS